MVLPSLTNVIKKPLVFSSVLGIIYSALGFKLATVAEHSLTLIGNSTFRVSLFLLGLIMSSYAIKVNKNIFINIGFKNILHPILMLLLVLLFGLKGTMVYELILLCAMPSATMTCMFALRYDVLTAESTSSTILGTLVSFITLGAFIVLTG